MKKVIVLIFICSLFMTAAHAQLKFGVKGGLTLSNLSMELHGTSSDYKMGGHAAVFMKTGKGLLGFQPEVMYIMKGNVLNSTNDDSYLQHNLNYIDVPLLLRISFNLRAVELYINVGPYGGYWINGKTKEQFEENGQLVTNDETWDFDKHTNTRFDAGIVGGVGVRVLFLMLEIRYGQGLIEPLNYEGLTSNGTNRYFNFSLGFQF